MRSFREVKFLFYWFILAVFILIIIYLYRQNFIVSKKRYNIHISNQPYEVIGKKVIFISDTHFRERNAEKIYDELIEKIELEAPEVILFGGDIVHASSSDRVMEDTKDFFFRLGNIAPTFVIYGNHDLNHPNIRELTATLRIAGVTLINNETKWISLGEEDSGFWLIGLTENRMFLDSKQEVMSKIQLPETSYNQPKILLTHFPEYFEKYLMDEQKRPDLVLSGHTHGGQIILPLIGGLFAPGQGANPLYDFGMFHSEKCPTSRLIVTRGVGNSSFPFRINNRPEYVVIEFN